MCRIPKKETTLVKVEFSLEIRRGRFVSDLWKRREMSRSFPAAITLGQHELSSMAFLIDTVRSCCLAAMPSYQSSVMRELLQSSVMCAFSPQDTFLYC
jgi:hypothetical protein